MLECIKQPVSNLLHGPTLWQQQHFLQYLWALKKAVNQLQDATIVPLSSPESHCSKTNYRQYQFGSVLNNIDLHQQPTKPPVCNTEHNGPTLSTFHITCEHSRTPWTHAIKNTSNNTYEHFRTPLTLPRNNFTVRGHRDHAWGAGLPHW